MTNMLYKTCTNTHNNENLIFTIVIKNTESFISYTLFTVCIWYEIHLMNDKNQFLNTIIINKNIFVIIKQRKYEYLRWAS